MEKHRVSRLSYLFVHLYLLSSYSFSSNLPLLSASALLCFSSLHIVGSLTSKLPSIIYFTNCLVDEKNILVIVIHNPRSHSGELRATGTPSNGSASG